ncbi:SCO2102 family sporulation regulator [Streptomyces sp. QTS137]
MGWTVLYIAFGVVALWLLGEVLLQYKARLRWRLLAFAGFLGVVLGVLIPSVPVIGLGAIAFAIGQTYVTLSFRRGFAEGWAVNAPLLSAVKGGRGDRGRQDPAPEVSDPEVSDPEVSDPEATGAGHGDEGAGYGGAGRRRDRDSYGADDDYDRDDVFTPVRGEQQAAAAETTAVYEPQPMPDDTGSYGVYNDNGYAAPAQDDQYGATAQDQYGATAQSTGQGYDTGQNYAYDYSGYGQQQAYDTGQQQQYAAYSDPYIGNPTYEGTSYDTGYTDPQDQYGRQDYGGQEQYGGGYGGDTPAGGLWVPQQRSADDLYGGELPQEQPYPYQDDGRQGQGPGNGNDSGYDEQQYRY